MYKNPCIEKTRFAPLKSKILVSLSQDEIENSDFTGFFEENLKESDHLILSHEALFHRPKALENICKAASKRVSKTIIIGYSRKVSGFIVSRYNQWGFRRTLNDKEIERVLLENEIDPIQFLGVEKEVMWHILTDFSEIQIANWFHSYGDIEKIVLPYGAEVRAGTLPGRGSTESLIENFSKLADLKLKEEYKQKKLRANTQFSTHLTESVKIAGEMGLDIPGPHSDNDFFREISKIIDSELDINPEFLSTLKEYIDSYFRESNLYFCKKYNLQKDYFEASEQYSRDEILKIIKAEQSSRISNNTMLKKYRALAGVLAESSYHYYSTSDKEDKSRQRVEKNGSTPLLKKAVKRIFGR
jgi:hypothetical protein